MKALWLVIAGSLLIVTAHVAYQAGQRPLREFDAECGTPGVRCVMVLSPEYVETHDTVSFPPHVTAALFDDDGSLHGVEP